MNDQLNDLKASLMALTATGATGFEGFMQIVLSRLTGIPFRLAVSGLQGGMDGDGALQGDAVSFEAKRYSGNIHRNEVLSKIADLARNNDAPDRLWVLGATTSVSSQLASAVRKDAEKSAISSLILDWSDVSLPPLAVAMVAAGEPAIDFLMSHCEGALDRKRISAAFQKITTHSDFESLLMRIRTSLVTSSLAIARACELNLAWRTASFESESLARDRFGQALMVNTLPASIQLRPQLREQVKNELIAGQVVVLSGGEGHGKSWLAAKICSDHKGISLFISAEKFDGITAGDLDEFLISIIVKQTGDILDEKIKIRWRHRISSWENNPPDTSLLVVVDGVNQRQNIRWDRIVCGLKERLQKIGASLVVTARPQFWQKSVLSGLSFRPKQIDVPEWTSSERDQLLHHYGIAIDWLDESTLGVLRNPRLLGVAVSTLPHEESSVWRGLTIDRLLFEHLRASQRENFEEESFAKLTDRISLHATKVLERVNEVSLTPLRNFKDESQAVIETRFFQALPGPGYAYELRSEGLTLALGYALIDQLWQAHRSNFNLHEKVVGLIEPIHAMDRTVDVIFSALMVCAIDNSRFDRTIFSVLLDSFSGLQNVDDRRFEEFVEIVKNKALEFMDVLSGLILEEGSKLNQDWFTHAALEMSGTGSGWESIKEKVRDWIRSYNKSAEYQARQYIRNDGDEYQKRLKYLEDDIGGVLLSMSIYERKIMDEMKEVSGDIDSLISLALKILVGHPLAEFSEDFVALGVAISLDKGTYATKKAFAQLTKFNRVDREEAGVAFLKAIEPLRASNPSSAGNWTVVRMLRAVGSEAASAEADILAIRLSEDRNIWSPPSPDEWRQCYVANPDAIRPVDIESALELLLKIEPRSLMRAMGVDRPDYDFQDVLPVICRFEPQIAFDHVCKLLSGLLDREGMPLRQLIFNAAKHSPLLTHDVALRLIKRVVNEEFDEALVEGDEDNLRMYLFSYIAPQLSSSEQLECLVDPAFGPDILLVAMPSLKDQTAEDVSPALRMALDSGNARAAYGALTGARIGKTQGNPELESLLLRCYASGWPNVHALSLALSISLNIGSIRSLHVQSGWTSKLARRNSNDTWYGADLLAEACSRNEITTDEMFSRIDQETWLSAAKKVGGDSLKIMASYFLLRLHRAVEAVKDKSLPVFDVTVSTDEMVPFTYQSIGETDRSEGRFPRRGGVEEDLRDFFGKARDGGKRWAHLEAVSKVFFNELRESDASLLVERVSIEDLKLLCDADPMFVSKALEVLERAKNDEYSWLRAMALAVANLASKDFPERSVALFERVLASPSFVTIDVGDGLSLEHKAIWSSEQSEAMTGFWRRRLLMAKTDDILALEVLAAERFGASRFIGEFVCEGEISQSSLDKAYAISVAGFSVNSLDFADFIDRHLNDKGITGFAARMANKEHRDFCFSKRLISDSLGSDLVMDFWKNYIIAETCMDARSSIHHILDTRWKFHFPAFRRVRDAAIVEKRKARKRKLLGEDAPDEIFIS